MDILDRDDVYLFVGSELSNISEYLQGLLLNLKITGLVKNITFYLTAYYRKYDLELTKKCIQLIRQSTRTTVISLGNDIVDNLQGFKQNLENLPYMFDSIDPANIKGRNRDKPAFIISAGPSLNKNINLLKKVKSKGLIIAVDTIVERLLMEGIVPDFVCTVERIDKVYEYFYKDKTIPKEVTLVAPPVIDSRILKEFKGKFMLPLREGVSEYTWFGKLLEASEAQYIFMGLSCAHVAFGLAQHMECSPIVLVGQDLAYGNDNDQTHASGTSYDSVEIDKKKNSFLDDTTEGYFGGSVKSTHMWLAFKNWFEKQINQDNLFVINATEGGAKINYTVQMPLENVISEYCKDIKFNIIDYGKYDLDKNNVIGKLVKEKDYFRAVREIAMKMFSILENVEISKNAVNKSKNKLIEHLNEIDKLKHEIIIHPLLMHNFQSTLIKSMWDENNMEQIYSYDHLVRMKNLNLKFLAPLIVGLSEMEDYIEKTIGNLENLKVKK